MMHQSDDAGCGGGITMLGVCGCARLPFEVAVISYTVVGFVFEVVVAAVASR